jgi:hypothetical protein
MIFVIRWHVGAWRSPVAQLHGVQKVAGSNPAAPTIFSHRNKNPPDFHFLFAATTFS